MTEEQKDGTSLKGEQEIAGAYQEIIKTEEDKEAFSNDKKEEVQGENRADGQSKNETKIVSQVDKKDGEVPSIDNKKTDADSQKLIEVEEFKKLKPKKRSDFYSYTYQASNSNEEKKIGFVISKKWIKSWKNYINYPKKHYNYYYYNQSNEEEKSTLPFPRRINDDMLMEIGPDFLTTKEADDAENHPVIAEFTHRINYRILNQERWNYLYSKYGGIPIQRIGTPYSSGSNIYDYDVVFQIFSIVILPQKDIWDKAKWIGPKKIAISKKKTIQKFKEKLMLVLNEEPFLFQLNLSNFRIWKFESTKPETAYSEFEDFMKSQKYNLFGRSAKISNNEIEYNSEVQFKGLQIELLKDKDIDDLRLSTNELIVLERASEYEQFHFMFLKNVKIGMCEYCRSNRPLLVACKCKEVYYCSQSCLEKDDTFHKDRCTFFELVDESLQKIENSQMGVCGLQNLGNTCFMNSGIQCISHVMELTKYFLLDLYKDEINLVNPLGLQGDLAKAWANVVKNLWFGQKNIYSPVTLKKMISKKNPAFAGYQQHDSHELICYLLDGIHEDLNRVKKKPIVELKEYSLNDDINKICSEGWEGYLKRNQSIIVDLFHGQFLSTVSCPVCNYCSVKPDPYNTISLQLPLDNSIFFDFIFVPFDVNNPPKKLKMQFQKNFTVKDFRMSVASKLGIHKDSFIIATLSFDKIRLIVSKNHKIKKLYKEYSNPYLLEIDPEVFLNAYIGEAPQESTSSEANIEEKNDAEKNMEDANENKNTNPIKNGIGKEIQNKIEEEILDEDQKDKGQENENGNEKEEDKEKTKMDDNSKTKDKKSKKEKGNGGWYSGAYYNYGYKRKNSDSKLDSDDSNGGIDDKYIRMAFTISQNVSYSQFSNFSRMENRTFQRMIFVERQLTLKGLHLKIFKYLRPYLLKLINSGNGKTLLNLDDNELKVVTEGSLEEAYELLTYRKEPKNEDIYKLKFINANSTSGYYSIYGEKPCYLCNSTSCKNCVLPCVEDMKIEDVLKKINPNIQLKNDRYCFQKRYESTSNFEFELDVELNEKITFPSAFFGLSDQKTEENNTSSDYNIHSLFELFQTPNKLEEGNEWYCSKCKEFRLATKKLELFSTPPILVVQFKRFKTAKSQYKSDAKYEGFINFPLKGLDLSKFVKFKKYPEIIYDLIGVSNHYGNLSSGHYTAYSLNENQWFDYDDGTVSKIEENKVVTQNAYVLFYKLRGFNVENKDDFIKIMNSVPENPQNSNASVGPTSTEETKDAAPSK